METLGFICIIIFSVLTIYNLFRLNKKTVTYKHDTYYVYIMDLVDPQNKLPEWLSKRDRIEIHKTTKTTHNKNGWNNTETSYKFNLYTFSKETYEMLKKKNGNT